MGIAYAERAIDYSLNFRRAAAQSTKLKFRLGCALLDDGRHGVAIKELESAHEYMLAYIIRKKTGETKVRLARHQLESDKKLGEKAGQEALA